MSESKYIIHKSSEGKRLIKKRKKLIDQFGGHCEKCPSTENLEFAHKVGFRTKLGKSRGMGNRLKEVENNPEQFLLLCRQDHMKYDRENPLTEEEKEIIKQRIADEENRVPF